MYTVTANLNIGTWAKSAIEIIKLILFDVYDIMISQEIMYVLYKYFI